MVMLQWGWVEDNSFDSVLKDAMLKKDIVVTFKTSSANISATPDYLPLVTVTGMLLPEANHVTQFYL